ncbi:MAG TPA: hypothetical protein VFN44_00380, partial [Solirubrobacteraceae bacterium]|nr:hypothetical protein [Solirubrobacteraceae bacterium]
APSEDAPRDPGRNPSPLPELPLPQPQPGAGTVESVVETVEKPLPPVVREPIEPVLDTVHQVGRTVDGVTGQLLPALP